MATTKATLLGHRSATSFSDLTLSGDLTVNGTTTTLDTAVQNVDKLEIGASSTDYGAKINQASTGNILQLQDGGTDVMVVKDGGNVGIGTDPSVKLQVKGILGLETTDSTNKWVVYAHTDDTLRLNYNGAGNDEVAIDDSGNVGIGTTSPTSVLTVKSDATNDLANGIRFEANGSTNTPVLIYENGTGEGVLELFDDSTKKIRFRTRGYSFFNGGNIGIGTDSPDELLHIFSSGQTGLRIEKSGGKEYGIFTDSTNKFRIYDWSAGADRLSIDSSGNFIGSSSADISDARLKENITDLTNSLEKISQLRGVRYTWKPEAKKDVNVPYYGLLAQELESVIPELVWNYSVHDTQPVYWKEGNDLPENVEVGDIKKEGFNYKSIHLTGLIPFLIEAVKELSAKVTALENA